MSKETVCACSMLDVAEVTFKQYMDATAEFDALWQSGKATASRRRMDELLLIIDAVERPHLVSQQSRVQEGRPAAWGISASHKAAYDFPQ